MITAIVINAYIVVPSIILFGVVMFVIIHHRPRSVNHSYVEESSWIRAVPKEMQAPKDWDPRDWDPVSMARLEADLRAVKRGLLGFRQEF